MFTHDVWCHMNRDATKDLDLQIAAFTVAQRIGDLMHEIGLENDGETSKVCVMISACYIVAEAFAKKAEEEFGKSDFIEAMTDAQLRMLADYFS